MGVSTAFRSANGSFSSSSVESSSISSRREGGETGRAGAEGLDWAEGLGGAERRGEVVELRFRLAMSAMGLDGEAGSVGDIDCLCFSVATKVSQRHDIMASWRTSGLY